MQLMALTPMHTPRFRGTPGGYLEPPTDIYQTTSEKLLQLIKAAQALKPKKCVGRLFKVGSDRVRVVQTVSFDGHQWRIERTGSLVALKSGDWNQYDSFLIVSPKEDSYWRMGYEANGQRKYCALFHVASPYRELPDQPGSNFDNQHVINRVKFLLNIVDNRLPPRWPELEKAEKPKKTRVTRK